MANIQKQGQLSARDSFMMRAAGDLFIWIGKRLKAVKTYEEFYKLGDEIDDKFDKFEEEHGEGLKEIKWNS